MVGPTGRAYVQTMPTTTTSAALLRLDHAELCTECHDLLPVATPVLVPAPGTTTCLACADTAPALPVLRTDPWSVLDDPELRTRLHLRRPTSRRAFALSA